MNIFKGLGCAAPDILLPREGIDLKKWAVIACDQYSKTRMGESVAVDPMGVTLASAGEGEKVIPVYIDTDRIEEVRKKLPAYKDRRPSLYTI